jgi:uncharacterized ferredoxin-like protein
MIIDSQNQFSAAQAVTSTGSTASTNVIDLGIARDIAGGVSEDIRLMVQVNTTFTSAGSATLQVQLQTSADNSAWTTLAQTDAIAVASLVQGYKFWENGYAGPTSRYIRLNYVVGTAAMTAGKIDAAIVPSLDIQPVYARGYTA